ncbi:hypothetical protein ACFPU1_06520 [Thalassorhabdus alkalitolerans]|uniref:Uncharacterized protein n=1 Tax=Thalassorhabdus alkalitolerans TaxID=2282697 RepID=A0ABW0YJ48_9BACI|nr:hypothetical protein [Thalassobacillus sp. C254]
MSEEEKPNVTENMEKGLMQSHGLTHEQYKKDVDNIMDVEKKREADHKKNKDVEKEINSQLFR